MLSLLLDLAFWPKCVAATALALALYWSNLPPRRPLLSAGLAVASYMLARHDCAQSSVGGRTIRT